MVAEPRSSEQISERICEQIADVHVPQVVEQIIEVPKMAEQILDVLVPDMVEQLVKLPNTVSQDRIRQRTVEQIVDTSDPQVVEKLVVVFRVFSQDRIQQRTVEQTIPATSLAEMIVEVPVIQTQGRTQQGVNTHVQHVVNTVEVERPKIIKQTGQKTIIQEKINQVTKVQTVQTSIEIPQLQYCDEVIDVPVVLVVHVPQSQVVTETAEIPQLHVAGKVVDVPAVFVVLAPLVQVRVVKKTVEDPQFQIDEKTAEAPQTQTIQVTQTSESLGIECDEGHELMLQGNDSVSVAKDVEDEANEVSEKSPDCMVCSSASGSMRQQYKQRARE